MQKYLFLKVLLLISLFFSYSVAYGAEPVASRFIYLQNGISQLQKSEKKIAIDVWNEWVA